MKVESPLLSPATIAEDLPCWKCDYNLRTQPHKGNCPECGTAVIDSVRRRHRVVAIDWRWIMGGSLLVSVAAACLLSGIFRFPHYTVPMHEVIDFAYYFGPLGAALFLLAGVVCLTRSKCRALGSRALLSQISILTAILYFLAVFVSTSLIFTDGVLLQKYSGIYVAHDEIRQWIPIPEAIAYLCAIGLQACNWLAIRRFASTIGKRWWRTTTTGYVVLATIPLILLFLYSIGNALSWQNIAFDPLGPMRSYVSDKEFSLERNYAALAFGFWLVTALLANEEHRRLARRSNRS